MTISTFLVVDTKTGEEHEVQNTNHISAADEVGLYLGWSCYEGRTLFCYDRRNNLIARVYKKDW